jgi:hypothetical protein
MLGSLGAICYIVEFKEPSLLLPSVIAWAIYFIGAFSIFRFIEGLVGFLEDQKNFRFSSENGTAAFAAWPLFLTFLLIVVPLTWLIRLAFRNKNSN